MKLRIGGFGDPRVTRELHIQAAKHILDRASKDQEFALNVVEVLLSEPPFSHTPITLRQLLADSNSQYEVRSDDEGLQERITPGAKEAVQGSIATAGGTSAGDHLTEAWNNAYGLNLDPVKSYSEAIKAVESAAAPLISPSNLKATLGTIRGEIKANPSKWTFVLPSVSVPSTEVVVGMISMLWEGQTSRHGGVNPTRPESIEEARAAVHLAATLVQWFMSGAIS